MPKNKIIKKQIHDKFYTKPEIARLCYSMILPYTFNSDLIIEPSAGSGSFFNCIREPKIGYDIEPEHPTIIKGNWFDQVIPENSVILGNPPYGSKNDLSKKFIVHSLNNAKIIAFVLPMVFRKETLQKVFPQNWKLIVDYELPYNSFTLYDTDYHVPATFQIWIKDNTVNHYVADLRQSKMPKHTTPDFVFTTNKTEATHFIFGAAPHKIINPRDVSQNNRGYYIVAAINNIEHNIKNIDWAKYALSSVNGGSAWYTKQQILNIYADNINNSTH